MSGRAIHPGDVLAGYGIGAVWLALILWLYHRWTSRTTSKAPLAS